MREILISAPEELERSPDRNALFLWKNLYIQF